MPKVTPFLWFDSQAQQAAEFYISIFKNSRIESANPMTVTFELDGQRFIALNGGPHYKLNEAFSIFAECQDQDEVDDYWAKLTAGGTEGRCGWLIDKFGLSWQVIPRVLGPMLGDPDREKAGRAMQAMLKMNKLDIAELKRAFEGSNRH